MKIAKTRTAFFLEGKDLLQTRDNETNFIYNGFTYAKVLHKRPKKFVRIIPPMMEDVGFEYNIYRAISNRIKAVEQNFI